MSVPEIVGDIIIVIGVIWIISGLFTYMQTVKTNNMINEIGQFAPRLYSGKNAGFMRTRRIIFAACANNGDIKEARVIHVAILLKPAKILDLPDLKGINVFRDGVEKTGLTDKLLQKAYNNLREDAKRRNLSKNA